MTIYKIGNLNEIRTYKNEPLTNDTIKTAVTLWITDEEEATEIYGLINEWDVSKVTDMSRLFNGKESFNEDISGWDVSSVNNMRDMFRDAKVFDQDISGWDVSNVM